MTDPGMTHVLTVKTLDGALLAYCDETCAGAASGAPLTATPRGDLEACPYCAECGQAITVLEACLFHGTSIRGEEHPLPDTCPSERWLTSRHALDFAGTLTALLAGVSLHAPEDELVAARAHSPLSDFAWTRGETYKKIGTGHAAAFFLHTRRGERCRAE